MCVTVFVNSSTITCESYSPKTPRLVLTTITRSNVCISPTRVDGHVRVYQPVFGRGRTHLRIRQRLRDTDGGRKDGDNVAQL